MVAEGFILVGYRKQILLVLKEVQDVPSGQQPEVQGPFENLLTCPTVRLLQPEQQVAAVSLFSVRTDLDHCVDHGQGGRPDAFWPRLLSCHPPV